MHDFFKTSDPDVLKNNRGPGRTDQCLCSSHIHKGII